ncbi:MAG: hypothetical protein R6X20_06995 [Phycisphaerae bacterium]
MRTGMLAAAVLVLAAMPAVTAEPEPEAEAGDAVPETDAQFFAELGYKPVATASDTARALVILVSEGKELGGDYDACRAYLRERGILPDGWLQDAGPDEPTTKGHLARLICKALGLEGGLWMRLFGPLPRIALNECAYLDLMTRGAVYRHVMGGELVGVIDRADRFRAMGSPAEVPKLEGEPSGAKEGAS